jgi:hypothetical protein
LTDPDRHPELDDPDPEPMDRYQCQAYEKVDILGILFPKNFSVLFKLLKIMTPLTLMRKIKHVKLAKLG